MKNTAELLEFNQILEQLSLELRLIDNKNALNERPFLNDKESILKALDETDEALILEERLGLPAFTLEASATLILSRLQKRAVLNPDELVTIIDLCETVDTLKSYSSSLKSQDLSAPFLMYYIEQLEGTGNIKSILKKAISLDGSVLETASLELKNIRTKINQLEHSIQKLLTDFMTRYNKQIAEPIVTQRYDHDTIPVKNDFKNQVNGMIVDQSNSGETVYVEPKEVTQAKAKILQLQNDERKEIARILKELSNTLLPYAYNLESNYKILCSIDFIFGKARLSRKLGLNKIDIGHQCVIYQMFHPLLKVEHVVKNDIILPKDKRCILITGPNTGGKTVLMKTLGLAVLMLKFGLLLPMNSNSQLPLFDNVYADIGDEQSIEQNLSTFSSHMMRISAILKAATPQSLVLLDELGSGTDPQEGSSLAMAILDEFLRRKTLTICSTHYSDLKLHAYQVEGMINASVAFNPETLEPTYKLQLGIPGDSNALKIVSRLDFPKNVLEEAEHYNLIEGDVIKKAVNDLNNQSRLLDERLKDIEEQKAYLKSLISEEEVKNKNLINKENSFERDIKNKQESILKQTKAKMDALIEELEELKGKGVKPHEIAQIKSSFREQKEALAPQLVIEDDQSVLNIGDRVYIKNYNSYGVIKNIKKNKKDSVYGIIVGNLEMSFKRADLVKTKSNETTHKTPTLESSYNGSLHLASNKSSRLDLRGTRYEDAKIKLIKFFDDAIVQGYNEVTIVHGFGTGVIRELVQNYVKKCKYVSSYRYGGMTEGGLGVTICTLK